MRPPRQYAFLCQTFRRAHVQCRSPLSYTMGKRKRSSVADVVVEASMPLPPPIAILPPKSTGNRKSAKEKTPTMNAIQPQISVMNGAITPQITKAEDSDYTLSDSLDIYSCEEEITITKRKDDATETPKRAAADSEADSERTIGEEEIQEALSRPPPVNSDYLPLPWKGRLGYACLNTYLRQSNPPVFSSRTCRIASILERRHPLKDPNQPQHPTKNRPDRNKPADITLGQKWVESLGLANARDIIKMVRWNDKYGIKFMRLSSEMFPFASHKEYGYKLAPFAAETLAEAGKVIAELGHRVTTHPGQFTQLGSPREQVIDNAIRDLEYHDEMLSLLNLPPQQNRDAVIILHMGGTFGSKGETLARFRENYAKLSPSIKNRLVLENDDVAWSVHDLLPICQELNIPLVLDFHHHNIIFDASKLREGTKDVIELFPAIRATWTRKGITQKMHYSEPTACAITRMQRRKHSPRVATLPPCPNDMDLMIEAKDKEQAVFELMRAFKLPGFERFNDIVPHVRSDENKTKPKRKKKASPEEKRASRVNEVTESASELEEDGNEGSNLIPEEEIGLGGPDNRVYWPLGMEEWLRPKKRQAKTNDADEERKPKPTRKRKNAESQLGEEARQPIQTGEILSSAGKTKKSPKKRRGKDVVPTPSTGDVDGLFNGDDQNGSMTPAKILRNSKRSRRVNYAEAEQSELD